MRKPVIRIAWAALLLIGAFPMTASVGCSEGDGDYLCRFGEELKGIGCEECKRCSSGGRDVECPKWPGNEKSGDQIAPPR